MTEDIISRDMLQSKLDALKSTIERKQWKYYHIGSVQNFILHLNNFPSKRTQNRIAGKINSYISLLEERTKKEHDIHELARELYPSIWSISDEYKYGLGFTSKPSYLLYLFVWLVLFFILKSYFGAWIAFGIVAAIGIVTIVRTQMKIKERKYY
jgi:Flp pilus assembly protein TadB